MLRHSLLDLWVACEMWSPPSLYTTLLDIHWFMLSAPFTQEIRQSRKNLPTEVVPFHTHTLTLSCHVLEKKWAWFILSDLKRSSNIFNVHIRSHPQVLILLIPAQLTIVSCRFMSLFVIWYFDVFWFIFVSFVGVFNTSQCSYNLPQRSLR